MDKKELARRHKCKQYASQLVRMPVKYFIMKHKKARSAGRQATLREWTYKSILTVTSNYWQDDGRWYLSINLSDHTKVLDARFIEGVSYNDLYAPLHDMPVAKYFSGD